MNLYRFLLLLQQNGEKFNLTATNCNSDFRIFIIVFHVYFVYLVFENRLMLHRCSMKPENVSCTYMAYTLSHKVHRLSTIFATNIPNEYSNINVLLRFIVSEHLNSFEHHTHAIIYVFYHLERIHLCSQSSHIVFRHYIRIEHDTFI